MTDRAPTSSPQPEPAEHIPLPELSFQVLLALGAGPAHGYGIGKLLEKRTDGRLRPTTGSLYQALRRLDDSGLVEEADAPEESDRRRQYFRLTALGRRVAALEAERLDALVRTARDHDLYPA